MGDRVIWRWNQRMVRREWRQLAAIALLIAMSVSIGVGAVLAAYNLAPPPEQEYGKGSVRASVVGPYEAQQQAFEDTFGEIGVVRTVPIAVPGSVARIELRSQGSDDTVAAPTASIIVEPGRMPARLQ